MSYWGSHFSALRNEEDEGVEKESDPDRQLVRINVKSTNTT